MALSQTDDYNLTRDQLIRASFETIGVAIANEPLEAEDIAVASVALNALSLSWKSHGLQLWKRSRGSVTLVQGTASYILAPTLGSGTEKPMRLLDVNRKETTTGNEVTVNRMSLEEYENLPNKTTQGLPVNYYFEPSRTLSTMYVWLAPDSTAATNYTIEYVYTAPIQDMDVGTEDIDYPNEWYRALILGLANDLAPKYGLDVLERRELKTEASEALELAMSYDVEDTSIYFSPDKIRVHT